MEQTEQSNRKKENVEGDTTVEALDEFADVGLPTNLAGSDEYFETHGDRTFDYESTERDIQPAYALGSPDKSFDYEENPYAFKDDLEKCGGAS